MLRPKRLTLHRSILTYTPTIGSTRQRLIQRVPTPCFVFANSLRVSEVNADIGCILVGLSDPPCGNFEPPFSEREADNGLGSQCTCVACDRVIEWDSLEIGNTLPKAGARASSEYGTAKV